MTERDEAHVALLLDFGVSLAVAEISWRVVEPPFLRWKRVAHCGLEAVQSTTVPSLAQP